MKFLLKEFNPHYGDGRTVAFVVVDADTDKIMGNFYVSTPDTYTFQPHSQYSLYSVEDLNGISQLLSELNSGTHVNEI